MFRRLKVARGAAGSQRRCLLSARKRVTQATTTLRIGNNATNSGPLCGLIGECRVLPYAVSDNALPSVVAALPG